MEFAIIWFGAFLGILLAQWLGAREERFKFSWYNVVTFSAIMALIVYNWPWRT